uniref:Uncharacterized protein n=1 Tax=Oryza sativa subsp. japonica TaxID=39947 RepID=Q654T9_ORYSJ|nr:hypothetical protein [Oryza sativa Japonica Group]
MGDNSITKEDGEKKWKDVVEMSRRQAAPLRRLLPGSPPPPVARARSASVACCRVHLHHPPPGRGLPPPLAVGFISVTRRPDEVRLRHRLPGTPPPPTTQARSASTAGCLPPPLTYARESRGESQDWVEG